MSHCRQPRNSGQPPARQELRLSAQHCKGLASHTQLPGEPARGSSFRWDHCLLLPRPRARRPGWVVCGFLIPRFCKVINICCFKILYLELTCYTVVANSQLQIHICMHVFMCMCGWVLTCSVVSDSLRPHGLQPTRLLCPWDSPGKNTGVGCHFLLQGIFPIQGSNLCLLSLLHWQAHSLSLSHQDVCVYV